MIARLALALALGWWSWLIAGVALSWENVTRPPVEETYALLIGLATYAAPIVVLAMMPFWYLGFRLFRSNRIERPWADLATAFVAFAPTLLFALFLDAAESGDLNYVALLLNGIVGAAVAGFAYWFMVGRPAVYGAAKD